VPGIECASEKREGLIENLHGVRVWGRGAGDKQGIDDLVATLLAAGVIRIAFEPPEAVLIERLRDAGPGVLALHPTRSKPRPPSSSRGSERDCL
jgi:hypothetical protein